MVRRLWLALALIALTGLPASAQAPPEAEVIEKIKLANTPPATLLNAVRAMPGGVSGVLAYPLDNSFIVRGTRPALAETKSALQVVDVPLEENRRLVVTLRRGKPEAVRTDALALPRPGTVQQVGDKTLRFEGDPEWLRAVQGVVFGAELTDPRPRPAAGFPGAGERRAGAPPPSVEILVPAGEPVKIIADILATDNTGQTRAEGNVAITFANGTQLRVRHARVILSRPDPKGETRVSIEGLPAPGN